MKRPNGILFDLGDTLLGEHRFNPVNGNSRLLNYADNTHGYTAEDVQKVADKIADELKQAREATMLEFRADCFQRLLDILADQFCGNFFWKKQQAISSGNIKTIFLSFA